jgi:osmotically-inducible protein OsmY
MVPDKTLQRNVLDELDTEPSVNAAHIGVAARDGVVTLTGVVGSADEKLAAEKAARRATGVKAVALELEIRVPAEKKVADDDIAQRVLKILQWDAALRPNRIRVRVEHGVVTISGDVGTHDQREAAERDVRKLSGVQGVINELRVKRAGPQPDDLREHIATALRRDAELEASGIEVSAVRGRVILSGSVTSAQRRELVEQAVRAMLGVSSVDNRIAIAPGTHEAPAPVPTS